MNKVKVLHTDNSIDYTGGFKALFEYIISEREKIDSVVILPRGSKCVSFLQKENICYYEMPYVEIQKNVWSLMMYLPCLLVNAWKIKKIASDERVNVFHSNDLYNLTLYVTKYIYRYKAPLVTHLRLMPNSFPRPLYNFWKCIHMNFSDELVAVSNAVKKAYNKDRIHVVYDFVDQRERYPKYEIQEIVDQSRSFRFLYLANYTRGKGQELAIEAFREHVLTFPNTTLTFVGGDLGLIKNIKFKEELMHSAELNKFSSKIIFEGFANDVEFKMKQYDCILNFSMSESFSYTSYEALKLGVPLIVTDCGGPSELFKDEESGILIKGRSIKEIVMAMSRVCSESELLVKFSKNSRRGIEELNLTSNRFDYISNIFLSFKKGA